MPRTACSRDGLPPSVAGIEVDPAGPRRRRAGAAARPRDPGARRPCNVVGGPAAELVDAKDSTASGSRSRSRSSSADGAAAVRPHRSVLVPLKALVLNALTLLADARRAGPALPGRARRHHAAAAVHVRLRALDGLRGVPARPDQGGVGPAHGRRPGGERPRGAGWHHGVRPGRDGWPRSRSASCSEASRSASWPRSGRSASGWRSPSCSTSRWSAACCCPPRCRCSAAGTGGLEPSRKRTDGLAARTCERPYVRAKAGIVRCRFTLV